MVLKLTLMVIRHLAHSKHPAPRCWLTLTELILQPLKCFFFSSCACCLWHGMTSNTVFNAEMWRSSIVRHCACMRVCNRDVIIQLARVQHVVVPQFLRSVLVCKEEKNAFESFPKVFSLSSFMTQRFCCIAVENAEVLPKLYRRVQSLKTV